jgi:hypothetical protein
LSFSVRFSAIRYFFQAVGVRGLLGPGIPVPDVLLLVGKKYVRHSISVHVRHGDTVADLILSSMVTARNFGSGGSAGIAVSEASTTQHGGVGRGS